MAQERLANHKQFSSHWSERDEAILVDLLKRKIGELRYDINEASSPYSRARLKTRRAQYKRLLVKIESGNYNSDILANQMASYQMAKNRGIGTYSTVAGKVPNKVGKYVDSYESIDFDFDAYFRRSRYYGVALPLISLILAILFLLISAFSLIVPSATIESIETSLNETAETVDIPRIMPTSVLYFKLTEEDDFLVLNDGLWPSGTFAQPENAIKKGVLYETEAGFRPESVWLYKDLNMTSINITANDVLKAVFYTDIASKYQIKSLEDFLFPTERARISWYYRMFVSQREDTLKIQKDANGKWNAVNIINNLATYGTVIFFYIAMICCALEVIINIARMFTHTSRRFHAIPIILLVSLIMTIICPVFSLMSSFENSVLSKDITTYFTFSWDSFLQKTGLIGVNYLLVLFAGLVLIYMFLPKLFKNRAFKSPSFVPKGNRAHTFKGNAYPTKPGKSIPVSGPAVPSGAPQSQRPIPAGQMMMPPNMARPAMNQQRRST
ncbi:MAG: hypothetical protein LBF12_01405 [Christensenellaceae bacterium]|jgi:hypothetical protein|nr:hypothetical protein [Christensenellaceae bacterium]